MIDLFTEKKDCCGCSACMNICPKNAIHMKEDEYGFVYPEINKKLCIECRACKKVCAFQNRTIQNEPKVALAIAGKNDTLIKKSASGGLFATMSLMVLEQGGCVYGAVMRHEDHKLKVFHVCCETIDELGYLQGSKYIQSSIRSIFKDVQEKLKHDRVVLFSGTPCQVDALKSYLKKDYEKLITVDIICHGVPNEKFFNDYIYYIEKKIGGKIFDFKFRDKSTGWGYNLAAQYVNQDGNQNTYRFNCGDSSYFGMFINSISLRENCYSCKYTNKNRTGDITIGDYWGIDEEHPEALKRNGGDLCEKNGISLMLLNTWKGRYFFECIKDHFIYYDTTFEKASKHNTQLVHPVKYPKSRRMVLNLYKQWGYGAVEFCFWCSVPKQKAKNVIRRILPSTTRATLKKLLRK